MPTKKPQPQAPATYNPENPDGTTGVPRTPEERQLNTVLSSFEYSRNVFSFRFVKFRSWLRLFHRLPDNKPPFRSNLFVPLIYPLVMTVLPRMVANKPSFRFEPREESDTEAVEQVSTLVNYQLDETDFFPKLKAWVKDTLVYGTGLVKLAWKRDEQEEYNDIDIQNVDLFDFFPDPKATEVWGGDFMIHRSIVPKSWLDRQDGPDGQPLYFNLDKIKGSWNSDDNYNKVVFANDRSMTIGDIDARLVLGTPYRQSLSQQVELLEYWGVFGDKDEEHVITVANRNTIIRFEKNPYGPRSKDRPFVKMAIDPNNFLFHGTGMAEVLEHLQMELNDARNQRKDNVNLILNKFFIVLREANVDEQELISRPGGVIYEDIPGGVRILETPDVTQSGYQEEALIKDDAQNAVGVSDIIQGNLQSAEGNIQGQVLNKTATGAQLAVEQAGSRFKYYLDNIEDALTELGKKWFKYDQLFMSEEKMIRVEAPNDYQTVQKQGIISKLKGMIGMQDKGPAEFEFKRISPDAIRDVNLDVKVRSGSTQPLEESLKQRKVLNLISLFGQLPVTTPETYMALAEEILEAYQTPSRDKIMKTLQIPQPGPKANVSVSLRGDLNPFQSADIAKTVGASDQSTDPNLVASLHSQDKSDKLTETIIRDAGRQTNKAGQSEIGPTNPSDTGMGFSG